MERELNLIPGEILEKEAWQNSIFRWGGLLAGGLVFMVVSYGLIHVWNVFLSQNIAHFLQERAALQSRSQVITDRIGNLRSERDAHFKIEQTLQLFSHEQGAGAVLKELGQKLPSRVKLTQVEIHPPNQVRLQGRAMSNADLADFMERVQHSPLFSGIELKYSRVEIDNEVNYVVFEIAKDERLVPQK
jgi:Tfp pilus assembly protein PilN